MAQFRLLVWGWLPISLTQRIIRTSPRPTPHPHRGHDHRRCRPLFTTTNTTNTTLTTTTTNTQMFAKKSGTKVESMYAWIDEVCIDQGTWAKYPDIGMAFVYGT